jgi:hypothetical protein
MRTPLAAALLALALASPAAAQTPALRPFGSLAAVDAFLDSVSAREAAARQAAEDEVAWQTEAQQNREHPFAVAVTPGAVADSAAVVVLRLLDRGAGRPLPDAVVTLREGSETARTDAAGRARLVVPVPAGGRATELRISRLGYWGRSLRLRLSPGDSVTLDATMQVAAINLDEVVVTGASVSITNTQHDGVDEGGIVKVANGHLVVLRRGRLHTVALAGGALRPVATANAWAPGAGPATYYDELLVHGDRAIVLGYGAGDASEVNVFRVGTDGALRHEHTLHLRSDDYYSSRNYASRLVDGKLVLYSPLYLSPTDKIGGALPAMRRWRPGMEEGDTAGFAPTVSPARLYRPAEMPDGGGHLALHTVTTCDVAAPVPACRSTALLGPESRVFYVSPAAVYVWTAAPGKDASTLYRMPLDGGAPSAVRATGAPIDQLSFLEEADGHLNVLLQGRGRGEGMWAAEHGGNSGLSLLRLPRSAFGDGRHAAAPHRYRRLPGGATGVSHNRWVGRHLLYAGDPVPEDEDEEEEEEEEGEEEERVRTALHVAPTDGGPVTTLRLPFAVTRIEAMGARALAVGSDGKDLHLTGISLGRRARIAQRLAHPGVRESETRTHGFFYRADGPAAGTMGIPVQPADGDGWDEMNETSAAILYVRRMGDGLRALGELRASVDEDEMEAADDACEASCDDWYGNTRPIFLQGRIFALLGDELVEGEMRDGRIRETRRVRIAPVPPAEKP